MMTLSHVTSDFNNRTKETTNLDVAYEKIRQHVRDDYTKKDASYRMAS